MTGTDSNQVSDVSKKTVDVKVNNKPVKVDGLQASGQEIKDASIEQGVAIESDFQLAVQLPDGRYQIIGDDDPVEVSSGSVFVATACDDNSSEGVPS